MGTFELTPKRARQYTVNALQAALREVEKEPRSLCVRDWRWLISASRGGILRDWLQRTAVFFATFTM